MGRLVSNSPLGPGAGRSARLITRLVASPCTGAKSRTVSHHRAHRAAGQPNPRHCVQALGAGALGPSYLPHRGKLLAVARLRPGVSFTFCFLNGQGYFISSGENKGEKTPGGGEAKVECPDSDSQPSPGSLLFWEGNVLGRAGPSGKPAGHQHTALPQWPPDLHAEIGQLGAQGLVGGRRVLCPQEPGMSGWLSWLNL